MLSRDVKSGNHWAMVYLPPGSLRTPAKRGDWKVVPWSFGLDPWVSIVSRERALRMALLAVSLDAAPVCRRGNYGCLRLRLSRPCLARI